MSNPSSYSDLIDEMSLALTANIEYLKKEGSSQIRLRNGRLVHPSELGFIYEFELERVQDIDLEADIELKVGNSSANGKVIAITDEKVQVDVDEHLGDEISQATLIISSYYLLERLRTHLQSVKSGETDHSDIAEKVFKINPTNTQYDESYRKPSGIDESQAQAIKLVLGSDVSFIWGPPGTGKSQTIAALIEELIDRKLSVLLIAHTNAATDSVMGKVVELVEEPGNSHNDDYLDGKFLRIGKKIGDDLKEKLVIPERVLEVKARPIREEIDQLRTQITALGQDLELADKVVAYQKSIDIARKTIEKLVDEANSSDDKVQELKSQIASANEQVRDVDSRIAEFQGRGKMSRMFSGTSLEKLTKEKMDIQRNAIRLRDRFDSLSSQADLYDQEIEKHKDIIRRIKTQLARIDVPAGFNPDKVRKDIKNCDEQIKALEKQLEDLGDILLADAKVIATTLTQTYISQRLLLRKYDVVILDEASMAPLPAVASVAGIANKKICLVGDFFQLPPIAKHRVDAKNKTDEEATLEQGLVDTWLKQDVFTYVGIEKAVTKGTTPDPWLSQLKIQYRMHPDISFLINELVYGKHNDFKLENGSNTLHNGEELLQNAPLENHHIGVVDTSKVGAIATKSDSGSWYNVPHAIIAVDLARQAIKNGYKNVGIISAYRAQVNLINKMIIDELKDDAKFVEADTVHRFQGGAKEIVIFDVTTPLSLTMYDDTKEGGDDMKLINVAFSRAQDKLVILADAKQVKARHSDSSLIRNAIQICEKQARPFIDAKEITDDFFADDRTEKWIESLAKAKDIEKELANATLVDQHDFYPLFIKDLLTAKKEVIIQSAFITLSRLESLLPTFKLLQSRGVRIFVITRVPWENDGVMQKQSEKGQKILEDMGVIVLPFLGKIHQKFSIVDRRLMWDGSLNILSQRDSQEIMRRCVGEKTVKQYMEFMRLDKNIGELGQNNLKHCAVCTLPGSYMWTKKVRGKMWTFCLTGNHSASMEPKTAADRKRRDKELHDKRESAAQLRTKIKLDSKQNMLCPIHNRILVGKTGRFGDYWECPNSKECSLTVSDGQRKKIYAQSNQSSLV